MAAWNNDILFLARKLKNETSLNWPQIAEIISTDFTIDTYEFTDFPGALRKAVQRQDETSLLLETLPDPTPKQFSSVLELPTDNALLVGDLHIDYYDRDFLKIALRKAEQYNCKGIILGGDTFNGGELSTHYKDEPYTPFVEEIQMVGKVLSVLGNLPWVEWIGIVNGNHDRRFTKKLNAYTKLEHLVYGALAGAEIKAKLYITDRDYAYYGDWGVGHLSNWCKEGGKLAFEQAKKHNKRVFAVWHDHIQGIYGDTTHLGISVGSMLVEDSQFYKERALSKFSSFVNGYLINNNGKPILYNKHGLNPISGVE